MLKCSHLRIFEEIDFLGCKKEQSNFMYFNSPSCVASIPNLVKLLSYQEDLRFGTPGRGNWGTEEFLLGFHYS